MIYTEKYISNMIKEFENGKLYKGDCLEIMKELADKSVDMILCDLPYGTTACKWDTIIPFEPLWEQYERIIKDGGAIVLTAREPFTSALVMSNPKKYKHKWVWNKKQSGSPQNAKYMPLQIEEDVIVFCDGKVNYYPIMRQGKMRKRGGYKESNGIMGEFKKGYESYSDLYFPTNIIEIANPRTGKLHPTQKPSELFEYLISTYTIEGQVVLDNCAGSGTTGIAAINTNRKFILMEQDDNYFDVSANRIEERLNPSGLSD
jgi:site-specific DNA-methyltransferase (adenine-specific)